MSTRLDEGVKKWFFRRRKALGNKSPNDILNEEWSPKGKLPKKILELAQGLRDGNAT